MLSKFFDNVKRLNVKRLNVKRLHTLRHTCSMDSKPLPISWVGLTHIPNIDFHSTHSIHFHLKHPNLLVILTDMGECTILWCRKRDKRR
jgi:hypothetical protein